MWFPVLRNSSKHITRRSLTSMSLLLCIYPPPDSLFLSVTFGFTPSHFLWHKRHSTSVSVLPQQCCGLWRLLIPTVNSTQRHRCLHANTHLSVWVIVGGQTAEESDSGPFCTGTIYLPARWHIRVYAFFSRLVFNNYVLWSTFLLYFVLAILRKTQQQEYCVYIQ